MHNQHQIGVADLRRRIERVKKATRRAALDDLRKKAARRLLPMAWLNPETMDGGVVWIDHDGKVHCVNGKYVASDCDAGQDN